MWWDGPWYGFHWMWIFPLIFLVLFALFFFREPGWPMCGRHGRNERAENAREILDRRYTAGEINREEYQRMRKDLE